MGEGYKKGAPGVLLTDPYRWRDDHSRGNSQHARDDEHPVRVLRERHKEREETEARHSRDEHSFTAQQIS